MRAFSISALAVLVIAALFWGNCLSCPQMLQAQSHGCCPHSTKTPDNCRTQVLHQFVKADPGAHAQVPAISVSPAPALVASSEAAYIPAHDVQDAPDLLSLEHALRI